MQSSAVTLKELSRLSGFSVSTVSKALNNKLDISPETRRSIKGIAEKYNYIPNNFAVGLRKKRTYAVAIIIPQVNTDFEYIQVQENELHGKLKKTCIRSFTKLLKQIV